MVTKQRVNAKTLGIDLSSKNESETFRWLLACLLFGKPIQQEIAARAYKGLANAGITSLYKLTKTDWDALVALLDKAHYVRYDFSTATKLIQVATSLKTQYGSVGNLIKQSLNVHDLEKRLLTFKGVGPVTAGLFAHEVAPFWFTQSLPHDYETARWATNALHNHGYEAYIIGGAVRDLFLGNRPKDFDLATNATPEKIASFPEFEHARYDAAAQAYGVTRVKFVHNGYISELEIATFRKDLEAQKGRKLTKVAFADLEEDVLRRDFTINALALDPSINFVIDFADGIDDLEQKVIRFIGKPGERIIEDPLRVMRAIRFKNHLGFSYHTDTIQAIRQSVSQGFVEKIATDRMRDELTALLIHPSRRQAITDLDNFGILERVLPEVTSGKNVSQPPEFHAEGDVWQHELLILDYLPHNPSRQLVWAALLHDIGKGPSRIEPRDEKNHIRFHRHYAVGAEMAKTALRRLNFSNRDVKDIAWIIYNHMAIDDLPSMRPSRQQRMMGHEAFENLLELHRADAGASWRPGKSHRAKPRFREIERLWHTYQSIPIEKRQPSLKRDLGIDGTWLIENFEREPQNIPGPIIGKVLAELEEWYRDEGVRDMAAYEHKTRQLLKNYLGRSPE